MAALLVFFNHRGADARIPQHFKEIIDRAPAADNQHILHRLAVNPDCFEELGNLFVRRGNAHRIPRLQNKIARGNIGILSPQDPAHKEPQVQSGAQIIQRHTRNGGMCAHHKFRHLHLTVAEGFNLGSGRKPQRTVNLPRRGKFGVDGEGEVHLFLHQVHQFRIGRVPHPRDGVAGTEFSCRRTAENVDLILRCHGNQKIRPFRTRAAQNGNVRTVSFIGDDVTSPGKFGKRGGIVVDHRHIVPLFFQLGADGSPHRAAADNYNIHKISFGGPAAR